MKKLTKKKKGFAQILRTSLPNAFYIGFTGTPLSKKEKDTRAVFGKYIDIYDITQSIEDKVTTDIVFNLKMVDLQLNDDQVSTIEKHFERMYNSNSIESVNKLKKEHSNLEAIFSNNKVIDSVVNDILEHYENSQANTLKGKAMIVAYSRAIAMKMYNKFIALRPEWKDKKLALIMTSDNKNPEEWKKVINDKEYQKQRAIEFKKQDSELKIVIVVDMWLTGFDVPCLSTMYILKPMIEHNLMQAIARVNRVFPNKEKGLIVDYIGIYKQLNKAMTQFSSKRDIELSRPADVREKLLPEFEQILEEWRKEAENLKINCKDFESQEDGIKMELIVSFANYLLDSQKEEIKKVFVENITFLKQNYSLVYSVLDDKSKGLYSYFSSILGFIKKSLKQEISQIKTQEDFDKHILNLTNNIVNADKINIISDNNLISLIDDVQNSNIYFHELRRLVEHRINIIKRTNKRKSEIYSQLVIETIEKYKQGIEGLRKTIEEVKQIYHLTQQDDEEEKQLELTTLEKAYYDIFKEHISNENKEFLKDMASKIWGILIEVNSKYQIDFFEKEQPQSDLKSEIKRFLSDNKIGKEKWQSLLDDIIEQFKLQYDSDFENEKEMSFVSN
ncbi:type I restriction enzyme subunit R domain-containing protein [Mycoplasma sp. 1654_15]|uniref:type I restriction enzyme subunit R domain-containing protein n=1 Tax=Mycoplasma sp. 1654_15 TaxID=2725994 RepID=UPI001449021E|nr:type I restriction enzyme endonuclease domain-containing protein [Mycoplasma sp. 1654_15]QJB71319.1 type I restriction endonuclease subunit R [Mycoplasma sp. 1654_15]